MLQTIRRLIGSVILTWILTLSLGCGGDAKRLEVHPVKGTVIYKGEPMKGGGSILFMPTIEGGKEASGTIEQDGTFTLKTYEDGDGAAAGQYRIVVYQVTVEEPENTADGEESTGEPTETVPAEAQIPRIYSNGTRSPLQQEVKAEENDLRIELEANPNTGRPRGA